MYGYMWGWDRKVTRMALCSLFLLERWWQRPLQREVWGRWAVGGTNLCCRVTKWALGWDQILVGGLFTLIFLSDIQMEVLSRQRKITSLKLSREVYKKYEFETHQPTAWIDVMRLSEDRQNTGRKNTWRMEIELYVLYNTHSTWTVNWAHGYLNSVSALYNLCKFGPYPTSLNHISLIHKIGRCHIHRKVFMRTRNNVS